jgi:arylsulfatase A-like enzyme
MVGAMPRAPALALVVLGVACGLSPGPGPRPPRPSILLVTLDTTRADAIGPEAAGVETPAFDALAARGRRFRHAYASAPETLPSHASTLTGLLPAGHGVHENGRGPCWWRAITGRGRASTASRSTGACSTRPPCACHS